MRTENEYVNESQLAFEITVVNLKEKYKKFSDESIKETFNKRVASRIESVKRELEDSRESDSYKDFLSKELEYLEGLSIEKQNKERLGVMVLLIIKNLARKPCFAGYSNNWKDEFYSKAVENVFKYLKNFDEEKISKRTGKRVSAFSYITQVVYTAFLLIINERKKEEERKNFSISLESSNIDNSSSKSFKASSTFDFQYSIGIQKNIKEEFSKVLDKIKELEEVENLRNNLDIEVFCMKNNKKSSKLDSVFDSDIQEITKKLNEAVFKSLELKRYLNTDYIPKELNLVVLKNTEEKFKNDILDLCNKAGKIFTYREVTKEEYNKLRNLNKKIPQKIEEDW